MGKSIHATAVSFQGRGLLILGPSGSGKSSLALDLMAFGAALVSDDRCILTASEGDLFVSAPETIKGKIEARGAGILRADTVERAQISLVVDLGQNATERLPAQLTLTLEGVTLPLVHKVETPSFPAFLLQYLKGGRCE